MSATSASSGAITYSYISGPATLSGSTVTLTGVGTVTLQASQAANGNYNAATATTSFTVTPATPTLIFTPIASQTYGVAPFPVSASSASSGAITYTVISGNSSATISGSTVTITGVGTVTLQASQAANGNYAAATATTTFAVTPATPTLAFLIASQIYGVAPFTVSASSASTGAITYSWISGPATLSGSTVTVTGVGSVTLQANQAANGNYAAATATTTFAVTPATPTLAFPIASQTYGAAPFAVSASSASSGAITYSYISGPATLAGSTVTITGVGSVTLQASQAANGNYAAATATTTFAVTPATPTLAFPIASQTYGVAPFTVTASSASSGTITYSNISGPATLSGSTVTINGVGPVPLQASQAANGNYAATTATSSFSVAALNPNIVFATITPKTYGVAPFTVSATSASSGAVTYTVTSGPATISGSTVTLTGAGTVVLGASQAASGNYGVATASTSFNVAPLAPTITTPPASQTIVVGQTATFTVVATGSPTLTYQWYENGNPISGATSISYTTPAAVIGYTGSRYSVVVTNTAVSATSSKAKLTVNTVPLAINLVGTPSAPPYNTSSTLVPTFSGGTAVIGSTGPGSSDITGSAVSGNSYPTPALTAAKTYTLTVTGTGGNTDTISFTVTPTGVTISPIAPAGQTMAPGSQTFTAVATGGATNTLKWTASGGSITSSGGVWTSPNTAGTYTITATSNDELSVFVKTTVTVSAPVVVTQPASLNLCAGTSGTLSVVANYAVSYQWYQGITLIPGATSSSYFIASASPTDAGNYTVVITNPAGSVTSNAATVSVGSTIASQPSSISVFATQTTTFSVAASGVAPFTYQWYLIPNGASTGVAITGATSSSYTTPVLALTNSGDKYYVVVSDACNVLTSSQATLTVSTGNAPPTIVTQPQSLTTVAGGTPTFTVVASGSPTLTYQWYEIPAGSAQGTNNKIAGATSASYTLPASATAITDDQDAYYVVVTNPYGEAVSQQAMLAVGNGILITQQPESVFVNPGAPASFTVAATSLLPLSYQWYTIAPGQLATTATAIPGANSATYTNTSTTLAQTGSLYYVVVSNGSTASVTSDSASLFVGTTTGVPPCSSTWNTLGNTQPFNSTNCSFQTAAAAQQQHGEIIWPSLISTGNIQLSFTISTSNPSTPPADGFAIVLGDPSLGATLTSLGATGLGLGAEGIPGFVLAFDDYYNGPGNGFPGDPSSSTNPAYLGVGRGETALWENPYFNVNNNLPGGANALAEPGQTISHNYVVTLVQGQMTVTMDGTQVFSGNVSVPPVAYLYFTSSTGADWEQTVISNIQAIVTAPSN